MLSEYINATSYEVVTWNSFYWQRLYWRFTKDGLKELMSEAFKQVLEAFFLSLGQFSFQYFNLSRYSQKSIFAFSS